MSHACVIGRAGRRGVALLLVLWAVVFLTLLVTPLAEEALAQFRLAARRGDLLRARIAARSGLECAIAELGADDVTADGLKDRWSDNPAAFRDVALGAAGARRAVYQVRAGGTPDGKQPLYGVVDEDRKIDVLRAPDSVLERCPGMTREVLEELRRLRAAAALAARGAPPVVWTVRSLLALGAVKPGLYFGEDFDSDGVLQANENDGDRSPPPDDADGVLRRGYHDVLTVSTDGKVNVNTASVDVLAATTALSREQATRIAGLRAQREGPYGSLSEVARAIGLGDEAAAGLEASFKVTSSVFRVVSRGTVRGTGARALVEAVVRREKGRVQTIAYREE